MAAARDELVAESTTQFRTGDDVVAIWSDITNGVPYDRDDSLKGNTNPKCVLKDLHPHHHAVATSSSSQRFSGNLKPTAAPIIGLPGGSLGGQGARRHHHPPAIFPKKAKIGGGGRQAKPAVPEPRSPKVSCFGKVRSDRERSFFQGRPTTTRSPVAAPRRTAGCCGGLGSFMRRNRSRNSAVECVDQSPPRPPAQFPPPTAARQWELKEMEAEAPPPAPGLGGLRRFSSGRRAADWAAEMEHDDGRVARSGPL